MVATKATGCTTSSVAATWMWMTFSAGIARAFT
jgi:hypothetical protein